MNKLMDKTYLQGFDAESIKRIAHGEFGIALSRTIEGKRKKFTKAELIEDILTIQANQLTTIEVSPETIVNEVVAVNLNNEHTVQNADTVIEQLQLSNIIPFALAKLKEINCKQELLELKTKLLASFNDKQQTRKRTLKSKWSMQYNRLTMLFKQAELKLQ